MRKHFFRISMLLLLTICVVSCTNGPEISPITPDTPEPVSPPAIYSREFWGEWKKMDQSETWLINSSSITVNGTILSEEVAWMEIHSDELKANWSMLSNGEGFFKIDPLR